ncbi:MAG: hypothetical protein ACPGVT_01405 [Maricaulaceae bacterium]
MQNFVFFKRLASISSRRTNFEKNHNDEGFVLPYVLAVVAILAVAGAIAMGRLQRSTNMIAAVQAQTRAESIMASVEAQVIHALLSASPVVEGYDLNPESPIWTEFGFMSADAARMLKAGEEDTIEPNIWKAKGEPRLVNTPQGPAIVTMQDVSGFASINRPGTGRIKSILEHAGLSSPEARRLIRRLQDYTDMDDRRSAQGAERRDYYLKKRKLPTNSPLRSYGELISVMGWSDALLQMDKLVLMDLMTLSTRADYRKNFARAELVEIIGVGRDSLLENKTPDFFDTMLQFNTLPSGEVRFTIWVPRSENVGPGTIYDKRVVEISHRSGGVGRPYRRLWVYETIVLGDALEFDATHMEELKNVIHTPLIRP